MSSALRNTLTAVQQRVTSLAFPNGPFTLLIVILVVIGIAARVSPLFDPDGRLFWQYMTEDGYLMQTIARNMAIGLGMTTSEGTIATNGVQPLATYIFAGLFWLVGGSKTGGIALVMLTSALFSALAGYFLYRLAALVLRKFDNGRQIAMLIAGLWFASPLIIPISMNGLETSLYYVAFLATAWYYISVTARDQWAFGWRERVLLGVLLGVTFLSRNDAVFIIATLLLVHLFMGGAAEGGGYGRRLLDCTVAGLISVAVASPWLVYNYRLFGSIVPISGTAQSANAELGNNLALLLAKLFEDSLPFLLLPNSLEANPLVMLGSLCVTALGIAGFWYFLAKQDRSARRIFFLSAGMVLLIGGYYSLFFGAPHFMTRYLSILSPLLWLGMAITLLHALAFVSTTRLRLSPIVATVTALLAVVSAAFATMSYMHGTTHMHKQVVEWTLANVPESAWVGAVQTGTLGYFHDRTLNLDGKVNPNALRAILSEGHILNYVVASPIDYIVDWVGMADWVKREDASPAFAQQFEVVVRDDAHNLAALKRIELKTPGRARG